MFVKTIWGIFEVIDNETNIKSLKNKGAVFVRAESVCGLNMALVQPKEIISYADTREELKESE